MNRSSFMTIALALLLASGTPVVYSSPLADGTDPNFDLASSWVTSPDSEDKRLLEDLESAGDPQKASMSGFTDLTAEQYVRRGELRIKVNHDNQGALDDAMAALVVEKGSYSAFHLKATALRGLGRNEEAAALLKDLVATAPNPSVVRREAVHTYLDVADEKKAANDLQGRAAALAEAKRLLEEETDTVIASTWQYRLLQAHVQSRLGEYAVAVGTYQNVLEATDTDPDVPLIVSVECAEARISAIVSGGSGELSEPLNDYKNAVDRLADRNGGNAVSFPPEWRLRRAAIMKTAGEEGWRTQVQEAITTINRMQALTHESERLYAMRAFAGDLLDYPLSSRTDALTAWKLHYKQVHGEFPTSGCTDTTRQIMETVLGSDHLLFRQILP